MFPRSRSSLSRAEEETAAGALAVLLADTTGAFKGLRAEEEMGFCMLLFPKPEETAVVASIPIGYVAPTHHYEGNIFMSETT
jgi:hypothetical protein